MSFFGLMGATGSEPDQGRAEPQHWQRSVAAHLDAQPTDTWLQGRIRTRAARQTWPPGPLLTLL